jgi:predicted nucleic acid-binding Zn ribbon protein
MRIEDIWEELMGKTIARYTDNIQLVNHTLFITTSVAPLRNELVFQKNQIRQKVNEALGEEVVRDIVIQ